MCTFKRSLFLYLVLLNYSELLWSSPRFHTGDLKVHTKFTHYFSKANFSPSGDIHPLSGDNSLSLFTTEFGLNYSTNSWFKLFSTVDYTYGQSLDPYFKRSNSSITGFSIGGQFLIDGNKLFLFIPEVSSLTSFISIDPYQESMILSEGVHSLLVGSHILLKYAFIEPYIYLGFQNRSKKRSELLQWRAGFRKEMGNLYIGSQLAGFTSLSEDGQKNSFAERDDLIYRVNAGSLKFFSYNESHISFENWIRWALNQKWAIQLEYKTSISGKRYAKGYDIGFQVIYNLHNKKRKKRLKHLHYKKRRKRRSFSKDNIQTFSTHRRKIKKPEKSTGTMPNIKLRRYKKRR